MGHSNHQCILCVLFGPVTGPPKPAVVDPPRPIPNCEPLGPYRHAMGNSRHSMGLPRPVIGSFKLLSFSFTSGSFRSDMACELTQVSCDPSHYFLVVSVSPVLALAGILCSC